MSTGRALHSRAVGSPSTPHVERGLVQLTMPSSQICCRDPDCAHRAQWPKLNLQWLAMRPLGGRAALLDLCCRASPRSGLLGLPGSSLSLPPSLQSAGNAHVSGWRVTFTPTGWQASHRVQSDRTPAATAESLQGCLQHQHYGVHVALCTAVTVY